MLSKQYMLPLLSAILLQPHSIAFSALSRIFVPPSESASALPSLQKALDSLNSLGGGTLLLGTGIYRIDADSGSLECTDCKGILIEGEGAGSLIRVNPGSKAQAGAIRFIGSDSILIRKVRMEGARLPKTAWGDNPHYHGALLFSGCRSVSVDSCGFSGFFTGGVVFQSRSTSLQVTACNFDGVAYKMGGDYGAIALESGSSNANIIGNRFAHLTHSAISAYGSENLIVSGNRAEFDTASPYTMGFYAPQGLRNSTITGNQFLFVHNEGIILSAGVDKVENNRLIGNTLVARFSGISINEADKRCGETEAKDILIATNRISGFGEKVQHGILLNKVSRIRLSKNRIAGALRGINIQNCSYANSAAGNAIVSSITGIVWNGNGTISDNRFASVGVGIECDHAERLAIKGNRFQRVGKRVSKGPKVLRLEID
jgi:hypothetical protein